MLSKTDAVRLLDYTVWANHRVMRASATISPAEFRRDMKGSHGGVRGTLAHMFGSEWAWLERWKGISPTRLPDEGEFTDVVALRDRWTALEEHRRLWLSSQPEALDVAVNYKNTQGRAYTAPLWQLVQHVANHATYHRGQVIVMLRQLGARVVASDLVLWDREKNNG